MFRSLLKLAQTAARTTVTANSQKIQPAVVNFPVLRKYTTEVALSPEEKHDAAWVHYFLDDEIDTYGFIIGFTQLMQEDMVPEPKIIQSALYACRRLDNFPMSMRVLEMAKQQDGRTMTLRALHSGFEQPNAILSMIKHGREAPVLSLDPKGKIAELRLWAKCEEREDIYNYLVQELEPTLQDLGLTTVEAMGLHEVDD